MQCQIGFAFEVKCQCYIKRYNNLIVKNNTDAELLEVQVEIQGQNLTIPSLSPATASESFQVEGAYRYAYIQLKDGNNQTYVLQPIDFTGETFYTRGTLTYLINGLDTSNQSIDLDYIQL